MQRSTGTILAVAGLIVASVGTGYVVGYDDKQDAIAGLERSLQECQAKLAERAPAPSVQAAPAAEHAPSTNLGPAPPGQAMRYEIQLTATQTVSLGDGLQVGLGHITYLEGQRVASLEVTHRGTTASAMLAQGTTATLAGVEVSVTSVGPSQARLVIDG